MGKNQPEFPSIRDRNRGNPLPALWLQPRHPVFLRKRLRAGHRTVRRLPVRVIALDAMPACRCPAGDRGRPTGPTGSHDLLRLLRRLPLRLRARSPAPHRHRIRCRGAQDVPLLCPGIPRRPQAEDPPPPRVASGREPDDRLPGHRGGNGSPHAAACDAAQELTRPVLVRHFLPARFPTRGPEWHDRHIPTERFS